MFGYKKIFIACIALYNIMPSCFADNLKQDAIKNKYLVLSTYVGSTSYLENYGNHFIPTNNNGISAALGYRITDTLSVEAGLSYGFKTTNNIINNYPIIPGGTNHSFANPDVLSDISSRINSVNVGLLNRAYTLHNLKASFLLGMGVSYTTVKASWYVNELPSCILEKTAMTPYFSTGFEYKLQSDNYLRLQYTYNYLGSMGLIHSNFLDSSNYSNNRGLSLDVLIKPYNSHAIMLSYILNF
jgi:hypothetical protein